MITNKFNYDLSNLNLPNVCPVCGGDLEVLENGMIRCINKNCEQKVAHKIEKCLDKLGVKGAGPAYFTKASKDCKNLFDYLSSITKSDEESVKWANGINGEKVAKKVRAALKKEIAISTFISCFDIEAVGEGQIDKVLTSIPKADLNFFLHPGSSKQFICEGISDILADKIYYGMIENVEEIEKCLSFFNVKSNEPKVEKTGGKLAGLSFCFTGAMSIKRSDLEKMVVENGGTVGSVNKNLSFLVQQDPNSTSTKSEKAKKFGTKIISPEEFLNMLK